MFSCPFDQLAKISSIIITEETISFILQNGPQHQLNSKWHQLPPEVPRTQGSNCPRLKRVWVSALKRRVFAHVHVYEYVCVHMHMHTPAQYTLTWYAQLVLPFKKIKLPFSLKQNFGKISSHLNYFSLHPVEPTFVAHSNYWLRHSIICTSTSHSDCYAK